MLNRLQILVLVVLFHVTILPAFGIDAGQQLTTADSVVRLQRQVNSSAAKATNQLQKIRNPQSAQANAAALSAALQQYHQQLGRLNALMASSRPKLTAPTKKTADQEQRWNQVLKENATEKQTWLKHLATQMSELDRMRKLKGLGAGFWNKCRLEIAEFEWEVFETLAWMNQPPPQSVLDFFKNQVEMIKRFGAQDVVEVNVANNVKPKFNQLVDEISTAAGAGAKVIKQLSPTQNASKIVVAPAADFAALVKAITAGEVSRQDEDQRAIWVGDMSGSSARGGGDITFVVNGTEAMSDDLRCLSAIWRDATTGKLLEARSQGGNSRGKIKYGGSVQTLADQITFGTVQSVDEQSRRIVIKADPEKLNASSVIAMLEGVEGPSAAKARAELMEFAENDKIENTLEAIEERVSSEQKSPLERTSRPGRRGIDSEAQDLQAAIDRFNAPVKKGLLTNAEIAELAEMLHHESVFAHRAPERAASILLKVDPKQVTDKKVVGRIATGFRKLALDTPFPEGELIHGLVHWGGKHSLPYLVDLVEEHSSELPPEVFAAMIKFDGPRGAEAVAKRIDNAFDREMAAECLRRMKHFPEQTIIKVAPSKNSMQALVAIELLGDRGTKRSLSLLRKADKSRDPKVREAAQAATRRIKERMNAAAE